MKPVPDEFSVKNEGYKASEDFKYDVKTSCVL
jgi:hypothetical protein